MLRAVTGMTTTVTTGLTAAEVEGTGGAIWLESEWVALTGYMHVKNDSPGIVHTCMDAAGCVDESSWLIWVRVTQISRRAHNLLESKKRAQSM
jgi:hypothetical protein